MFVPCDNFGQSFGIKPWKPMHRFTVIGEHNTILRTSINDTIHTCAYSANRIHTLARECGCHGVSVTHKETAAAAVSNH